MGCMNLSGFKRGVFRMDRYGHATGKRIEVFTGWS